MVAGKFRLRQFPRACPFAIKAAGISCVVAQSFARIFYRNAINIGLPIVVAPDAVKGISTGDNVEVDVNQGYIYNSTTGEEYETETFPPFIQEIIEAGNLLNYVQNRVKSNG